RQVHVRAGGFIRSARRRNNLRHSGGRTHRRFGSCCAPLAWSSMSKRRAEFDQSLTPARKSSNSVLLSRLSFHTSPSANKSQGFLFSAGFTTPLKRSLVSSESGRGEPSLAPTCSVPRRRE